MSPKGSGIIGGNVAKPILVLGDDLTLAPRIAAALAADPAIECVLTSRDPDRMREVLAGTGVVLRAADALATLLGDAFAVINTSGPFIAGEYPVAAECARRGVHYLDLGCAREYVTGIGVLGRKAQASGALVVAGAGMSPAVSGALADYLATEFDQVREVNVALAIPDRDFQGQGVLGALRPWVGSAMQLKRAGRWRESYGWSEPAAVEFPKPFARRRAYLCDAVELALFPQRYRAQTVTFRAALEGVLVSWAMALLARARRRRWVQSASRANGAPLNDTALQRLLQSASAIRVQLHGQHAEQPRSLSVCLAARSPGRIPISASPAIALARRWAREGVAEGGTLPCIGLVDLEALKAELLDEDMVLVRS